MDEMAGLRRSYQRGGLDAPDLDADPLVQLQRWLVDAREALPASAETAGARAAEANAMALATVSGDGVPSVRTVLLKGLDASGLVFYTSYASRKARDLHANPRCAVVFTWYALERQVRVEGAATPVDRAETEAYFATRPRESQLGAWASEQSAVVESRAVLEQRYEAAASRFPPTESVPPPPDWGGYRIVGTSYDFWQGRTGRMHDRFRYSMLSGEPGGRWRIERLGP